LMRRRYLAFGLVAACFAAVVILAAVNGTVQGVALQAVQHLPNITMSEEPVGNETHVPGSENGLVTALGGIALLASFLIIMLAITLRKRKKQGL
jgi:hypothetical protein